MSKEVSKKGKFLPGESGNPAGRPKGSKNQVTILKLMAEEAIRTDNAAAMMRVCRQVIEKALEGHHSCEKLVWNSMVTKGATDDRSVGQEKLEININTTPKQDTVTIIQEDDNNE